MITAVFVFLGLVAACAVAHLLIVDRQVVRMARARMADEPHREAVRRPSKQLAAGSADAEVRSVLNTIEPGTLSWYELRYDVDLTEDADLIEQLEKLIAAERRRRDQWGGPAGPWSRSASATRSERVVGSQGLGWSPIDPTSWN